MSTVNSDVSFLHMKNQAMWLYLYTCQWVANFLALLDSVLNTIIMTLFGVESSKIKDFVIFKSPNNILCIHNILLCIVNIIGELLISQILMVKLNSDPR